MVAKKRASSKKSRQAKRTNKHSPRQDTCFIIMPFGEWFDYYYETIYIPAIEASGLISRRADDLYRPSAIVNDIWALTQQARIILADLSGKNPNVFYELGMAHAIAKPAILITETMDDVPFDLRSLRVIVYDKNVPNWGEKLRKNIETSIKEVLDSPLDSVLPTFIKIKESTTQPSTSKTEKELISIRQDVDMLKREFQSRGESSVPDIRLKRNLRLANDYAQSSLSFGTSASYIHRRLIDIFGLSPSEARLVISASQKRLDEKESSSPPVVSTKQTDEEDS